MPYTATTYTTGGTATAANLTHGETQYSEATQSFQPNLFTPFVYSGLVATKDATVLSQLDVTSGTAYLLQTDNTLRQRTLTSSTQTTATANTTYYLDLNPDGTWSWGTAHSAQANYLPIASVTTDASGNIAAVTDTRGLNTTLLSGMAGNLTVENNLTVTGSITAASALATDTGYLYGPNSAAIQVGNATNGDIHINPGPNNWTYFNGAGNAHVDNNGNITAPNFTGNLLGDGEGFFVHDDGTNIIWRFATNPTTRNLSVQGWVASGGYYSGIRTLVGSDGNFYTGVNRNGSNQNSKIYTGTNSPTAQGVGDIWIAG